MADVPLFPWRVERISDAPNALEFPDAEVTINQLGVVSLNLSDDDLSRWQLSPVVSQVPKIKDSGAPALTPPSKRQKTNPLEKGKVVDVVPPSSPIKGQTSELTHSVMDVRDVHSYEVVVPGLSRPKRIEFEVPTFPEDMAGIVANLHQAAAFVSLAGPTTRGLLKQRDEAEAIAEAAKKEAAEAKMRSEEAEAEARRWRDACEVERAGRGDMLRAYTARLFQSETFSLFINDVIPVLFPRCRTEVLTNVIKDHPAVEADKEKYGYQPMSEEERDEAYMAVVANPPVFPLLEHLAAETGPLTADDVNNCSVDVDAQFQDFLGRSKEILPPPDNTLGENPSGEVS